MRIINLSILKYLNKTSLSLKCFAFLAVIGIMTSCGSVRYSLDHLVFSDSFLGLTEYDMFAKVRNLDMRERYEMQKQNTIPTKMRLADIIYTPEEPSLINDKLVSINVTEEVPIIDLILEIGRITGADIQVDPALTGGIILNLKDRPLKYVFNRICGMTNIRYREKNGIIIFERDTPYVKTYYLDFLDMKRSSSSSMNMNTSLISNSGGGSSASVSTSSNDELWESIQTDIKQLISVTEKTYKLYSSVAEESQRKQIANGELSQTEQREVASPAPSASGEEITGGEMTFNKRGGIMTITASDKSHRKIAVYLEDLKRKVNAQVLIEMKFVEVTLNKKYQAGIDWSLFSTLAINNAASVGISAAGGANILSSGFRNSNVSVSGAIKALENFGSTRILQSPRINAINNQPSIMTIAQNKVYFKTNVTYTGETATVGGTTTPVETIQATPETVPLGVVMSVMPSIDLNNRTILLNLKPTISKSSLSVADPSVAARNTTIKQESTGETTSLNSIPETTIREFDTILKLRDGELKVVGGFTERKSSIVENGIPFLRSIPILGNLFKFKSEDQDVTETIILVKATIIDGESDVSEYEKNIYRDFSDDPLMYETLK